MRIRLLTAVLATALVGTASAQAATRYAAPDGSGTACTQASPCDLQVAVEAPEVTDGDLVVVTAGPYVESAEVTIADAIRVTGEGAGSPVVNTSALVGFRVVDPGAVLRALSIASTGAGVPLHASAGTVERIAARGGGAVTCALDPVPSGGEVLLRDSTCLNDSGPAGASAIRFPENGGTGTARLRNVTAYATGPVSHGLEVSATAGGTAVADARNAILSGTRADVAASSAAGSFAAAAMESSNYAVEVESGPGAVAVTDPGTGGNQLAEPHLADPDNGFFAQLLTSPTVDAGTTDPRLGPTDIDGEPRIQSAAPDIGADEIPDGVDPETTITEEPPPVARDSRPTFAFVSNEAGSTFECAVDDGPFLGCETPFTTPEALDHGAHSVRVRAIDSGGNVDETPAESRFEIDRAISGANAAARPRQPQGGKRVVLSIRVKAAERVRVRGAARIRLDKKHHFGLSHRTVTLRPDESERLKLHTARRSASRKILRALRGGGSATGTISATFTDAVGNRATLDVPVTLRRGKRG